MNKARRHELKILKYLKRIKQLGLIITDINKYHEYKTSGKPCSCWLCKNPKYRDSRHKNKWQ
jgi:hypothetical protein